jgi:hypothetical protein
VGRVDRRDQIECGIARHRPTHCGPHAAARPEHADPDH